MCIRDRPLAILRPDAQFTLLDSQEKRMGFLSRTLEELGVANAACACMRAEEAPGDWRGSFDIAVSRAVARLNVLCELCLPFVKVGGLFIAMKAEDCAQELEEARNAAEVLGGAEPEPVSYTHLNSSWKMGNSTFTPFSPRVLMKMSFTRFAARLVSRMAVTARTL